MTVGQGWDRIPVLVFGPMESYLVGLPGAAEALDVSRSTVKRLIAEGELEKVTIGRRALVPVASIEAFYVRRLEAAAEKAQLEGRFRS